MISAVSAILIYQRVGIFAGARKARGHGLWRLSRRCVRSACAISSDYLDQLESHGGEEWQAFTNALTTNLTAFFREPHHFEKLTDELRLRGNGGGTLQLWSCAASTGEEPYSMAITACETFGTLKPPVRILATDVDTQVLATASRGVYAIDRVSGLDPAIRKRYFQRGTGPNEGHCRFTRRCAYLSTIARSTCWPTATTSAARSCAVLPQRDDLFPNKPTQRASSRA